MSVTPEFRRQRARVAANARHHPGRSDDERDVLNAASRERKLRDALGPPPDGGAWLDVIRRVVDDAPPLTEEQRSSLATLLAPVRGTAGRSRPAPPGTSPA